MALELWSSTDHGVVTGVDSSNYKVYPVLFAKLARFLVSDPEYCGLASILKIDMIDRLRKCQIFGFFLNL